MNNIFCDTHLTSEFLDSKDLVFSSSSHLEATGININKQIYGAWKVQKELRIDCLRVASSLCVFSNLPVSLLSFSCSDLTNLV